MPTSANPNPLDKAALRRALRARRQRLSDGQQAAAAQRLLESVMELPAWADAQTVALYMAADGEISPAALLEAAAAAGKHTFLPVMTADNTLEFAAAAPGTRLASNRHGIPEPGPDANRRAATALDIIFLPLVGWDRQGNRLGMGGGYYDRTLSTVDGPLLVGLAHTCQQVERLPRDAWDITLHFVATDTALHCCRPPVGRGD